jgi:hypothetical protein
LIPFTLFAIDVTVDVYSFHVELGAYGLVGDALATASIPVYMVYIGLAALTFFTLISYKNRKRQLWLCRINLVLHLTAVAGVYAFYYLGGEMLLQTLNYPKSTPPTIVFSMKPGFFLIVSTIPLLLLAIRGIKSDEKLVKSLDRLR